MCLYIGIEDLAANALIESMNSTGKKYITYENLQEYGTEVVSILLKKGERAVLLFSRESKTILFRDYSDFFQEKLFGDRLGIALKDGIDVEMLIDKFRGYLSYDLLMAFIDKTSTDVLRSQIN